MARSEEMDEATSIDRVCTQICSVEDGTDLRFDADFTDLTTAEAATGSFPEDANGATVTINGTAWKYFWNTPNLLTLGVG